MSDAKMDDSFRFEVRAPGGPGPAALAESAGGTVTVMVARGRTHDFAMIHGDGSPVIMDKRKKPAIVTDPEAEYPPELPRDSPYRVVEVPRFSFEPMKAKVGWGELPQRVHAAAWDAGARVLVTDASGGTVSHG